MKITIYEEEMIRILDAYVKDKFSIEKHDSFITFEDDENLNGLNFIFVEKGTVE